MSQTQTVKFSCPSCSKEFNWRPEIAGKKAKCKCGVVIDIPAAPPPPPLPPPDVDPFDNPDYMYDFADEPAKPKASAGSPPPLPTQVDLQSCPNCGGNILPASVVCLACGYNTKTGRKHKTEVARTGPVLPYQRKGQKEEREPKPDSGAVKDIYIPLGLVAGGLTLSLVDTMVVTGISNFGFAAAWVAVSTVVNLVLVFIGMLISVKLLGLSLGHPLTAIIKITAIALIPGPISSIAGHYIGPGGDYIGWSISMIFYYGLFMYFFDMDFQETMICSVIIWLIRTFLLGLLLVAVLGGWMSGLTGGGDADELDDSSVPGIVDDADELDAADEE